MWNACCNCRLWSQITFLSVRSLALPLWICVYVSRCWNQMLSFRLQAPKIVTESGHTQGYCTQALQHTHTHTRSVYNITGRHPGHILCCLANHCLNRNQRCVLFPLSASQAINHFIYTNQPQLYDVVQATCCIVCTLLLPLLHQISWTAVFQTSEVIRNNAASLPARKLLDRHEEGKEI